MRAARVQRAAVGAEGQGVSVFSSDVVSSEPSGCCVAMSHSCRPLASPLTASVLPSGLTARVLTASEVSPKVASPMSSGRVGKTLRRRPVRCRSRPSHSPDPARLVPRHQQ